MKTVVKRKSFEESAVTKKPVVTQTIKTVSQDKLRALNAVIAQSTPKSAGKYFNFHLALKNFLHL